MALEVSLFLALFILMVKTVISKIVLSSGSEDLLDFQQSVSFLSKISRLLFNLMSLDLGTLPNLDYSATCV